MGQTLAGNDGDGATHSRCWLIYWQEIEPTFRRYQEAVGVDHVLAEHRAAIAAQPVDC